MRIVPSIGTQHQDSTMPGNSFPFSAGTSHNPTGDGEGSLVRHDGLDPLLMKPTPTQNSWQKGASLLGTEPLYRFDLPSPARLFLFAGTQHTGRYGATAAAGPCANRRNPHDPFPAARALLVALSERIATGHPAPESRIPKLSNGTALVGDSTLVPAVQLHFVALPGFAVAPAPDAVVPLQGTLSGRRDVRP